MSTTSACPRCGTSLEKEGEPCPRCLLELGRTPPAPASPPASGSAPRTRRLPAPTVEEVAKRFPELEIAARIGAGGMGAVYKARQPRIDRWVALKILSLDPADDPTFAERFRREAVVLARLDHPSVVKLYDFGEREGLFFLLLEFVDGPNLRTLMKQGLLAPPQALAIVPQICTALQFAHDEGIVHRDIKPENVLLDAKGRVKIADFGLAKLVDADARDVSLTEIDQVVGTPHYMAPEQIRGSREVDHRADIYSLGVVFYEMLTGELPRGNFELPSRRVQVDVRLDEIVLKSLERAPERRYQHAVEVKTDVENVGNETPVAPSGPTVLAGVSIGRVHRSRSHARLAIHPNRPWEFFVTYLLLWPLVGLAWNGGPWWFTGAMALVAAAFWSQVEQSIRARPDLATALEAESRRKRSARHFTALLLLGLGLLALFLGQVAVFGHLSPGYRAGPSDAAAMRTLDPRISRMLTELVFEGELRDLPHLTPDGVWALDHEKLWNSAYLLFLAPLLLGAAARAMTRARSSGMPIAAAVGAALGALALVEGFGFVLASAGYTSGRLVPALDHDVAYRSRPLGEGGTEDASRRLRIALIRQDYSITVQGSWRMANPGEALAVEVLFAEPASPFDRWRMSWSGPRREGLHAVFALFGARNHGAAQIACDLGDVQADSEESRAGTQWIEQTLALARQP